MTSEDCQKEVWNKSFITTPEYILHGWVNFRIISHRMKKDLFSISIRYNNELFTSLVLSINSRIFFLSICVLLDGVIHVIFFFALWKAGMISLIVKQYAFVRSNGKSYYYSEQEKFGLFFINFLPVTKFDPWYLACEDTGSFEMFRSDNMPRDTVSVTAAISRTY